MPRFLKIRHAMQFGSLQDGRQLYGKFTTCCALQPRCLLCTVNLRGEGKSEPRCPHVLKVTLTNLNATATAAPLAVSIAMSLPVTVVSQTTTLSNVTTSNNTISGMIIQSYQALEPSGLTSITVALMAATPFTGAAPGFFQPTAVVLNGNPCSVRSLSCVIRMPVSDKWQHVSCLPAGASMQRQTESLTSSMTPAVLRLLDSQLPRSQQGQGTPSNASCVVLVAGQYPASKAGASTDHWPHRGWRPCPGSCCWLGPSSRCRAGHLCWPLDNQQWKDCGQYRH